MPPDFAREIFLPWRLGSAAVLHSAFLADVTPLAPMKSAERSLISFKDSKSKHLFRLIPSRSDRLHHHIDIYSRNLWRSTPSLITLNYVAPTAIGPP